MMDISAASSELVPAVRFSGFNGEWDVKTFKNLTKINQGLQIAISSRHSEKIDNSYFYITNEFLKEGSDSEYFILNPPKSVLCNKNDVLMTRTGNTGQVVTNVEGAFHNNFFIIKFDRDKLDKNFLVHFLKWSKTQEIILNAAGSSTIPDLNHNDFYRIPIALSILKEQTKIGQYFQQLDTLIAQHQQKHDKLLNLKKSLLEKMFPKQGADEPAIRFKGFSGAWEETVLGDVVTFVNGRAYSQNELLKSGKYPVLRVGNFYTNSSWYYSDLELGDKYYADDGDLLYTWSASFGPHIWKGAKVIYHYHIWKLLLSRLVEKNFLLHVLNKDRENILSGSNGSTMIHITKEGMEKKTTLIPEKEEQKKLGAILDKLDTLITQHQTQLKKLTHIKQACLAKLFV